ncbi:MAG: hypothetical protein R3258_10610 [Acidimicrobiia bacterium]|nr:hypothetical protein [Acidimicrobiia bacterium]
MSEQPERSYEQVPIDDLLTLEGIQQRRAQLAHEARMSQRPKKGGRSHKLEKIKVEARVLSDLEAGLRDQSRDKKLDDLIRLNRELQEQLNRKQGAGAQRASVASPFGVLKGRASNSG